MSRYVRQLLIENAKSALSTEERLEYELDLLKQEMDMTQDYNSTLLKHGTYAKDYFNKLKDGNTVTHSPFRYSKGQVPTLSKDELAMVEETVKMREALNREYCEKLKQWLNLKNRIPEMKNHEMLKEVIR